MSRPNVARYLLIGVLVGMGLLISDIATAASPSASAQPSGGIEQASTYPPTGSIPPLPSGDVGSAHQFHGTAPDDTINRLKELNASYQQVFAPDERTRVSPTTAFPASAISLVITGNADASVALGCTGTMIGADVILTAAHCLYNPEIGGWAAIAVVIPGKDGDFEPFGSVVASDAWIPSGWRTNYDPASDWGLLKLSSSVGNTVGWFQIGVLSSNTLNERQFQPVISGYPGDKQFGTQWSDTKESFLKVDDTTLYTDIDAYKGQSGSAVRRRRDNLIVGVLDRETAGWNEATRIDAQFLNTMLAGCAALHCTFSYTVENPTDNPPPTNPSGVRPVFDSFTPSPFTTIEPGTVHVAAVAHSDSPITNMYLTVNGHEFTSSTNSISADISLSPGTYMIGSIATDQEGDSFAATWDVTVSSNQADSEWFYANGQPNADQVNATMRSLVEAFRWHLFGQSWDGSNHSDLPTHASNITQGAPTGNWVNGSTFDQASTEATLRSLVEAFRWHFWGISWDGGPHCDVPTHISSCNYPQPAQGIDPWFAPDGKPIPANINTTLRSLVEAFRWHFWGFSWDGADHSDSLPTHGL